MSHSNKTTTLLRIAITLLASYFGTIITAQSMQAQDPSPPAASSPTSAPATTPAAAPAATPPPVWSVGGIDFSGLVDGYYSGNFNNPASRQNQLQNFDFQANQFSLEMAKASMGHAADPIGFQVDLGFGKAFDWIHSGEPSGSTGYLRNVEQAYVSFKPAKAKGFEADFGQFVTSAGAEVIETMTNWNYSHSLLFAYAIPYYHFGLRTSMPLTKSFTGGFQLVNGWNDTEDNNTGKTLGFTGVYTKPKYTLYGNYYVGPENVGTNVGFRNLIDANLVLTPNAKLNAYINYDYGQNRNAVEDESGKFTAGSLSRWQGIAVAAHYQPTAKSSFTPRFEYFIDSQGFSTGTAQKLNEFTMTYEYKMVEGLLARVEFRNDHSNMNFFDKDKNPASTTNQPGITIGMIAFFGPKR
jgi:hypothetical protein